MAQPTVASTGRGAQVFIAPDAVTFTEILQAKNFSFSGPKSNYDGKTTLSSPGAIEEFQPTTIDNGTASATVVWNQTDAGQMLLSGLFYAQTPLTVKVQYPPQQGLTHGPIKVFNGYVSENGLPSLDITKTTEYTVQFKISGVIIETAGS